MAQPGQFYFDECLPYYLKALEVDPDDFETNFNIALLYYDQKREVNVAISYLKTAIKQERNSTAFFNLAFIYEEKGDIQNAKEYY